MDYVSNSSHIQHSARKKCVSKFFGALSQAAQRGQKQAVPTEADANDPLKDQYGDSELVQSQNKTRRTWTRVDTLAKDSKDAQVGEHCICRLKSVREAELPQ